MLLNINSKEETPIYQQIYQQIVVGIATGALTLGEQLPSVRQMADEIGVNMMTVSKAYTLLKNEGYILTDRRHGTTVNKRQPSTTLFDQQFTQQLEVLVAQAHFHHYQEAAILEKINQLYQTFDN